MFRVFSLIAVSSVIRVSRVIQVSPTWRDVRGHGRNIHHRDDCYELTYTHRHKYDIICTRQRVAQVVPCSRVGTVRVGRVE